MALSAVRWGDIYRHEMWEILLSGCILDGRFIVVPIKQALVPKASNTHSYFTYHYCGNHWYVHHRQWLNYGSVQLIQSLRVWHVYKLNFGTWAYVLPAKGEVRRRSPLNW